MLKLREFLRPFQSKPKARASFRTALRRRRTCGGASLKKSASKWFHRSFAGFATRSFMLQLTKDTLNTVRRRKTRFRRNEMRASHSWQCQKSSQIPRSSFMPRWQVHSGATLRTVTDECPLFRRLHTTSWIRLVRIIQIDKNLLQAASHLSKVSGNLIDWDFSLNLQVVSFFIYRLKFAIWSLTEFYMNLLMFQ